MSEYLDHKDSGFKIYSDIQRDNDILRLLEVTGMNVESEWSEVFKIMEKTGFTVRREKIEITVEVSDHLVDGTKLPEGRSLVRIKGLGAKNYGVFWNKARALKKKMNEGH